MRCLCFVYVAIEFLGWNEEVQLYIGAQDTVVVRNTCMQNYIHSKSNINKYICVAFLFVVSLSLASLLLNFLLMDPNHVLLSPTTSSWNCEFRFISFFFYLHWKFTHNPHAPVALILNAFHLHWTKIAILSPLKIHSSFAVFLPSHFTSPSVLLSHFCLFFFNAHLVYNIRK
jgi:hypothetical protein